MLWLFVIVMVGGLMFVMFHKPRVNPVLGLGAVITPPAPKPTTTPATTTDLRTAETQPSMTAIPKTGDWSMSDIMSRETRPSGELEQLMAEQARASSSTGMPAASAVDPDDDVATAAFVPMDFNDIFGRPGPGPTSGPRV